LTSENEGLSFIVFADGGETKKFLFAEAVQELKGALVGERIWGEHKCWPMYSKFFDNKWALPHHIHHDDKFAGLTGQMGKPEAYYFPPQANNYGAEFPYTFFGLEPGTTKAQVRKCLADFEKGDNKLTSFSKAYQLDVGTGWDVPPGVLHAPGSMCTYEPQKASDVFAMYESISSGDTVVPKELLWKDTPKDKVGDVDHLLSVIDWDLNVDPSFRENRFMAPVPVEPVAEMEAKGYIDKWICYKSDAFGAKELTVLPGAVVTIKDSTAYGFIMMQGHGTMGRWDIETPTMIRYGQLTHDEFFVSEEAAKAGVTIKNPSGSDPIVMLKHFGPGNPDMKL
jgi:hypothetical protein